MSKVYAVYMLDPNPTATELQRIFCQHGGERGYMGAVTRASEYAQTLRSANPDRHVRILPMLAPHVPNRYPRVYTGLTPA